MANIICGVDVASTHRDASIRHRGAALRRFARAPEGITALIAFCRDQHVELVVIEATGGYEKLSFALLWAADLPAAIVNPRAARRFEAMGLLEKTDRIAAAVIAWFGEVRRIAGQIPPVLPKRGSPRW